MYLSYQPKEIRCAMSLGVFQESWLKDIYNITELFFWYDFNSSAEWVSTSLSISGRGTQIVVLAAKGDRRRLSLSQYMLIKPFWLC